MLEVPPVTERQAASLASHVEDRLLAGLVEATETGLTPMRPDTGDTTFQRPFSASNSLGGT